LESGEASVLVDQTNRKPVTLVQGLRKAIETGEMDAVKVVQRKEETYLVRKGQE